MSTTQPPIYSTPYPISAGTFQAIDLQARRAVSDLHAPRPWIYWTDLLLTAAAGWGAFAVSLVLSLKPRPFSAALPAAVAIAVLALYRGLCFLHEITHLKQSALRGFETTWNVLFGVPLLMPSFLYVGVHQSHHKLSTYGTVQDPEYLPFSGRRAMIALFTLESMAIPLVLALRFLAIAPFGFLFPRLHRWLAVHASAFCMNLKYRREATDSLTRKMTRWESATLAVWSVAIGLAVFRVLPWRSFLVWYATIALVSLVNSLRTLGAHRYTSDGGPLDREGQLIDSIDTPGAFWTELWAPVGLRYHALHHYFPGIPYHNLKHAHGRLLKVLPAQASYVRAMSRSLPFSLGRLYRGIKN